MQLLSRALNPLFYSRRWSNHLVHLIYRNWLPCKRINSQSSVAPSSQPKLDCGFLLEKGVLSFLSSGDCVTLCLPGGIPRPRAARSCLLQRSLWSPGVRSLITWLRPCTRAPCSIEPNSLPNPTHCGPPGSSVHMPRILKRIAAQSSPIQGSNPLLPWPVGLS